MVGNASGELNFCHRQRRIDLLPLTKCRRAIGKRRALVARIDYNLFLASEAHLRGLKVGLKIDVAQVPSLAPYFDYAVNEQCHEYKECGALAPFTQSGKPVFNAEYKEEYVKDASARAALCKSARDEKLRTLVLPLDLDDSFRYSCDAE